MNILAFDTATDQLALGLADVAPEASSQSAGKGALIAILGSADTPCRRHANEALLPSASRLLEDCNLTFGDVDAFVVGRGPGSFTGVRIGIATSKGLAYACNKPLVGTSTLDAVAYRAWLSGVRGPLGVVGEAMRGEVYPGIYELDDQGVSRKYAIETVLKATDCVEAWSADKLHAMQLTGDGLNKYQSAFEEAGFTHILPSELWTPTGESLIYSAHLEELFGKRDSPCCNPQLVLPVYTRLSDAEEHELGTLGKKQPASLQTTGVDEEEGGSPYQLRPMRAYDVEEVAQLESAVYSDTAESDGTSHSHIPYSAETLRQSLTPASKTLKTSWWVAQKQDEIVGFAGAQLSGDTFEILDVAVHAAHRHQGLATKLLGRVTYDGQMLGATHAMLEVYEANNLARSLYTNLGFEEEARRTNYYGPEKDALMLKAALPLALPASPNNPQLQRMALAWPQEEKEHSPEVEARLTEAGDLILAIETSCDETAMAIIDSHNNLVANVVSTQIDFHARFGGVVPEIASRKHTEALCLVLQETLEEAGSYFGCDHLSLHDLSAVAVTKGPGLVGALVVGIAFAKGLAAGADLKLIGVNHLEGHLFANLLENPQFKPPFVASLVSGGNTMLVHVKDWGDYTVLGATIDDAVGEAFDKVAKALGLGYPGGPVISRLAQKGNAKAIDFPRALLHSHDYRFSLSGLKTAVVTYLEKQERLGVPISKPDVAASFQAAVIDVLVAKAVTAVKECNVREFCVGGGVAANPALRNAYEKAMEEHGVHLTVPPLKACTDNAAMIALVARRAFNAGKFDDLSLDAEPRTNGLETNS